MSKTVMVGLSRVFLFLWLVSCSSCSIKMVKSYGSAPQQYETLSQWQQSPLAREGKIFLIGKLDETAANAICRRLLVLDADDEVERITLFINSRGGVEQGYMAICNTIAQLSKPVDTVNQAYCMSAVCAVHQFATGKRYAYSNSQFLLHAPKLRSEDDLIAKVDRNTREYTENTAIPRYEEIITRKSDLPSDWFPLSDEPIFFTARQALEYRFVDEIIDPRPSNKDAPQQ